MIVEEIVFDATDTRRVSKTREGSTSSKTPIYVSEMERGINLCHHHDDEPGNKVQSPRSEIEEVIP